MPSDLVLAIRSGKLASVRAALAAAPDAAGVDPHCRDAKGNTPLDIARSARKPKIVAALS